MSTPPQGLTPALPSSSNQSLLGAALAGLLCLAPAACSGKEVGPNATGGVGTDPPPVAGASASAGGQTSAGAGGQTGAGAGSSDAGHGGAAGSMGGTGESAVAGGGNAAAGDRGFAGAGSGNTAGTGGAEPELGHITSSVDVGVLTEEDFKARCDARGGAVEVMPHCGGFATAKGFAYDNSTHLLSEHTCAGANTCGGWNCVLVD
jgi:hypothetical protein